MAATFLGSRYAGASRVLGELVVKTAVCRDMDLFPYDVTFGGGGGRKPSAVVQAIGQSNFVAKI